MTLRTSLCDRLEIELPIVQAPVSSAPQLAAAVTNAGGLGILQASWLDPDDLRTAIRTARSLTDGPIGVNLVLEWPQQERLAVALEEGIRIISLFWGDPEPYVDLVHDAGGLVLCTVGSAAEARRVVEAGVDVVVAQGVEAGGHVWGEVSTMVLVPVVVDAVAPVPVIAAGGIADGRGLAAALALGAQAGWVGTRFVASEEAGATPRVQASAYRRVSRPIRTTRSSSISAGSGHPTARSRTARCACGRRPAGPNPVFGPARESVIAHGAGGGPIVRYSSPAPERGMTGDLEALALYAGQSVGLIHQVLPAGEIVRAMAEEAERTLARLGG